MRLFLPKKRKTMFRTVFTTSLLCIIAASAAAIFATFYFTYHFVVQEKGKSRVDVLQQISDSNTVNRVNMVNVMNVVYDDFYGMLSANANEEDNRRIQEQLEETSSMLQHIGVDFTIDIAMNDKRVFSAGSNAGDIQSLKSSYWYIKHYSGETDTSWNLRFLDVNDISSYGLSYGRTVYDENGKSRGVIVVTSAYEALFRTFRQLASEGGKIYILDRNGIIISHTNPQRVGNWMANMDAFEREYSYGSSCMVRRGRENVMLANYRDPDSGWTFIEEQSMDALLLDGLYMIRNCMLAVLLGCFLAGWLAYVRVKQVTAVFGEFSEQIGSMPAEKLSVLPVREEYEETFVLSTTFNGMIRRIRELIRDIQLREQEKQRNEYDFLQAQINPHFLNNTLLAVKSLVAMGNVEHASRMMSELVELLHIPATPEIQFVTLAEELHLIRNYISIMNCRTEKGVEFFCGIPENMMQIPVPRMILQPVIGNSFFHGFAEKDEGCEIRMRAGFRGAALYIEVTDNGEGITGERLQEIASWKYTSENTHHGIGLKNIRRRLKIIYGGFSGVAVRSELGKSTTVTVTMDRYRALQIESRSVAEAAKEASNENYGG